MSGVPEPGQVVRVRSRQYLVEEVITPPNPSDQHLVRLSCLDDDAQGQPLEALWEKEVDARVTSDEAWRAVGAKGFDEPELFSAWLDTLHWNCVTSTDPRLFQSPWRAGIQVMTYQLETLRWLRMPGDGVFLLGVAAFTWFMAGLWRGWSYEGVAQAEPQAAPEPIVAEPSRA